MLVQPGQKVSALHLMGKEASKVSVIADVGTFEEALLTFPDASAMTQADYVLIENQAGTQYAVWFDIDADGTPPTGAAYTAAANKVEINILGTDLADDVAAAFVAGVSLTDITVTDNLDGTVSLLQDKVGATDDPVPHNEDDSGAGSISASVVTAGINSNLQSKYFTFKSSGDAISYYAWLNLDAEGIDPAPGGTGIEVAGSYSDSASTLAAAISVAINAETDFSSSYSGSEVFIVNESEGVTTDIDAGNSGFSVSVEIQGVSTAYEPLPGSSVNALDNTPGIISE